MFAGAGEIDVLDTHHLLNVHLVLDHSDLGELRVVESAEHFIDVHLGDAMRRLFQTVVTKIQPKRSHNVAERIANDVVTLISR